MKTILTLAMGATAALTLASAAHAEGGCGLAYHRGPYGHCVRNGPVVVSRPVVVVPAPAFRVGVFYPGRGYWDGRRWWVHREAWHGGWRYY
jgi:hypothetical protein